MFTGSRKELRRQKIFDFVEHFTLTFSCSLIHKKAASHDTVEKTEIANITGQFSVKEDFTNFAKYCILWNPRGNRIGARYLPLKGTSTVTKNGR